MIAILRVFLIDSMAFDAALGARKAPCHCFSALPVVNSGQMLLRYSSAPVRVSSSTVTVEVWADVTVSSSCCEKLPQLSASVCTPLSAL